MHEVGIATELLRMCDVELRSRGGGVLEAVRIAVGELASVDPELLQFAWQAVVQGGPHDGAELKVEWHRSRQLCDRCGEVAERQPGSWLRLCPICEQPLRIEGGDELDLLEVTVASRTTLPSEATP